MTAIVGRERREGRRHQKVNKYYEERNGECSQLIIISRWALDGYNNLVTHETSNMKRTNKVITQRVRLWTQVDIRGHWMRIGRPDDATARTLASAKMLPERMNGSNEEIIIWNNLGQWGRSAMSPFQLAWTVLASSKSRAWRTSGGNPARKGSGISPGQGRVILASSPRHE